MGTLIRRVTISIRIKQRGQFLVPIEAPQSFLNLIDIDKVKVGDVITPQEQIRFRMRRINTKDGREWLVAFTSEEEMKKGEGSSSVTLSIENQLHAAMNMENVVGIIINPWDQSFLLDKDLIRVLLNA